MSAPPQQGFKHRKALQRLRSFSQSQLILRSSQSGLQKEPFCLKGEFSSQSVYNFHTLNQRLTDPLSGSLESESA